MSRFSALPLVRSAATDALTANDPYWSFNSPTESTVVKEDGNVTHVEFSPQSPYELLSSSAYHMRLYSRQSAKVGKTFTRFREKCFSGSWRNDGLLIGAGSDDGVVRVFDKGSLARAPLREFQAHSRPCQITRFTADGKCVISAADDGIVRLWDIAAGEKISEMPVHNDYCRAGAPAQNDPNIFCSGGYDNTINVLDLRSQEITMSFDHGYPVESLSLFPSMSLIVSAGGPLVKIWDVYQRRLLTSLSQHTKTVTSVCLSDGYSKILSAGLDKRVNIFDTRDYQKIASVEFDSPILSMDLSAKDQTIAVGMAGGFLSVRQRQEHIVKEVPEEDRSRYNQIQLPTESEPMFVKKPGKESSVLAYKPKKTADAAAMRFDEETKHKSKKFENKYNRLFRKFEYNKVLTMALSFEIRRKRPEVLVAVLQELIRRNVIERTLSGRKESEVCSLLRFLGRHFTDLNWQPVLIRVLDLMIDLYQVRVQCSEPINRLFRLLNQKLNQEMKLIGECHKCLGMIESLTSRSAQLPKVRLPNVPELESKEME